MSERQRRGDREVWRARVSAESSRYDEHWQQLDSAEQRRAARFRTDADRARFVIARSSLRQLLGERLGIESRAIAFDENAFGKPCLLHAPGALHFNTSHSGDWVLHAFDAAAPIGIDVEALRKDLADIDQFQHVLSTEELAWLNDLPSGQRARAFATVWVRKEAYVKALGEGLSRSLPDISIGADTAGPRLLYDRSDRKTSHTPARWHFEDIELDEQHVACLVYCAEVQRG